MNQKPKIYNAKKEDAEALTKKDRAYLDLVFGTDVRTAVSLTEDYPRDMKEFLATAKAIIEEFPEIQERAKYSRPVGRDPKTGKQKYAEGASTNLTKSIKRYFKHLTIIPLPHEDTGTTVICRVFGFDPVTIFRTISVKSASIMTKSGHRYSDSMVEVKVAATNSIAERNLIRDMIGPPIVDSLADYAESLFIEDKLKTFPKLVRGACKRYGIAEDRICAVVGVKTLEDIKKEGFKTLNRLFNAIKEEETTVDEAFPVLKNMPKSNRDFGATKAEEEAKKAKVQEALDKHAKKTAAKPEPDPAEEPEPKPDTKKEKPTKKTKKKEPKPEPEPNPELDPEVEPEEEEQEEDLVDSIPDELESQDEDEDEDEEEDAEEEPEEEEIPDEEESESGEYKAGQDFSDVKFNLDEDEDDGFNF